MNHQISSQIAKRLCCLWASVGILAILPASVWAAYPGPVLIRDIVPGSAASEPSKFVELPGKVCFVANDVVHGTELWCNNGTLLPGGTALVKDINSGSGVAAFSGDLEDRIKVMNGVMYFAANDGVHGRELWKSDGTEAGTTLVRDINPEGNSSSPRSLGIMNGRLYFSADGWGMGRELWTSDGTPGGTFPVKDIFPGPTSSNPDYLRTDGTTLYFSAFDGTNGTELWKSDGTTPGTTLVKDINLGASSSSPAGSPYPIGNILFFTADDGSHGRELWKSDGTPVGTTLVKDIRPGGIGSNPPLFPFPSTNSVFMVADDGTGKGAELWKSDGTEGGTELVKDVLPGPPSSGIFFGNEVAGKLYFHADDGVKGRELWRSDGTDAGTFLVKDIKPGASSSNLDLLFDTGVFSTEFYFIASDGVTGLELWRSNGTEAGTVRITDINTTGTGDSFVLTRYGQALGTLFFSANNGSTGNELWVLGDLLADSDSDGLRDGIEDANHNGIVDAGETNRLNADTDGDDIQDGIELGVTTPIADPDGAGPLLGTNTLVFVPDADPLTTTSPTNADSDGDGSPDGVEDVNHNGRVDAGESNPAYPDLYPTTSAQVPALPLWAEGLLAVALGWLGWHGRRVGGKRSR